MGKLLVHIITGVDNPSRAVLGFAVAKAALEDGYEVSVFCAGASTDTSPCVLNAVSNTPLSSKHR